MHQSKDGRLYASNRRLTALDDKRNAASMPILQPNKWTKLLEVYTRLRPVFFVGHSFCGTVLEQGQKARQCPEVLVRKRT